MTIFPNDVTPQYWLHSIQTGHVLQFEIEINCPSFDFEVYVKLGVFDEDMQDISSLLNASPIDCENDEMIKIVRHISAKNENCLPCQISKRNSENIQAKNQTKPDGLALRVHPSAFELAENQAIPDGLALSVPSSAFERAENQGKPDGLALRVHPSVFELAENQAIPDGLALRVHPSTFELEENQAKKQRLQTDGSSGKHSAIDYDSILWLDENWLKVKQVGQNFLQVFDRKFLVLSVLCLILPSIFAMIHEE